MPYRLCLVILLAAQTSQTADRGVFGGSYAEAVWTVVAFLVLLVVLGRWAWRPLLANLKAREEHIRRQLEQAAQANRQAQQALQEARQHGLQIIEAAKQQAQQAHARAVRQTEEQLDLMRQDAQADIEHAKLAAIEAVWQQSTALVKALTEQVLGRVLTDQDDQRLIQQTIEQARQVKRQGAGS